MFAVVPDALLALVVDVAAEADGVALAGAAELPGDVLLGPGIGLLDLFTVLDDLAEHAVFVADAVTDGGDAQGGEAVHETGGEATEATVTKTGITFFGDDFIDVLPQFSECFAHGVIDVFGNQRVRQGTAHQEFHGEVVDAAQVFAVQVQGGLQPAFGGKIAHSKQSGVQPVGFGRFRRRAAETEDEFVHQCFFQALYIAAWCAIGVFLLFV